MYRLQLTHVVAVHVDFQINVVWKMAKELVGVFPIHPLGQFQQLIQINACVKVASKKL